MDLLAKMATFVRVVEAGSFSAAARQLRLSSAAVSRQIAALEGDVRSALLQRSTRRMVLTPEGSRYYEACRAVLERVDEARSAVQKDPLSGVLKVSVPVSYGQGAIVPHLPGLLRKHPSLEIDLRLEDSMIDLAFEGVDLAIRVGSPPPDSADLIAHPLGSFHRVVVASSSYLARRGTPKTPEALAQHDVLSATPGGGAEAWSLVSKTGEARRLGVKPILRSNAPLALLSLAQAGVGVALLPGWLVSEDLRTKRLRRLLPNWRSHPVAVHALHRVEHRGTARVRAFVDYLREHAPSKE